MTVPLVSIVIPTRNGMDTLPAALDAISSQRATLPFEVVAVDSGSTDGSLDFLRARVDRLIEIDPAAFDHGLTRNHAIEQSRAELLVLMVQDAIPADESWLEALTKPFAGNEQLAGAFARQVPRANASALTRYYLERWSGAAARPRTMPPATRAELDALQPVERMERCTFDNVCSCIRRSVWKAHPFRATSFGEDLAWARDVLLAGYQLAYTPEAVVIHSHDRSAWYEFARTYETHRLLCELFELRTIPTLPALARAVVSSARLHARVEWTLRAGALAVAWPAGQYLGALAAKNGWRMFRSRAV